MIEVPINSGTYSNSEVMVWEWRGHPHACQHWYLIGTSKACDIIHIDDVTIQQHSDRGIPVC